MNLNYLSLLDTDALKQVIANFDRHAIHHPQTARLSQQKLDAIERLETRPVDRLFTGIPVRGLASTLYLHPEPFVCEGEMYLLGTVLSHFLSLYASVNSFHMLTVVNTESRGDMEMDGKNRAASSYLSPGNPRQIKSRMIRWHRFSIMPALTIFCDGGAVAPRQRVKRGRQNYPCVTIRHRKPCVSAPMPALPSRAVISVR